MHTNNTRTRILLYLILIGLFVNGCSRHHAPLLVHVDKTLSEKCLGSAPVYLWNENSQIPRPFAASYMRIDIRHPAYEVIAMISDDPDGKGPAEAILTEPSELLKKYNAFAAVNANAFARAQNADDQPGWHRGLYVDIRGLAVTDGQVRSNLDAVDQTESRTAFWIDTKSNPLIGRPLSNEKILQAVGDWISPLLIDGRIVPEKGGPRHPRTVVGFDRENRFLTLAVIDGRREDYSDGMTLYESAELMKQHGCYNAINMDGGGSSVMIYSDDELKTIKTANRPSGNRHRPVPVMLGVRKK